MNEKNKKLEVGEKYLNISILGGQIKLVAFQNKEKTGKQPDYSGNGIAIWVNEKKAPVENQAKGI